MSPVICYQFLYENDFIESVSAISENTYPFSLLNALGINYKPGAEKPPSLRSALAMYLDGIIKLGDRESLLGVIEQVEQSAQDLAILHPEVALNAISAFNASEEEFLRSTGLIEISEKGTSGRGSINEINFYRSQKEGYQRVLKAIGLSPGSFNLLITDKENFYSFLTKIENGQLSDHHKELLGRILFGEMNYGIYTKLCLMDGASDLNTIASDLESSANILYQAKRIGIMKIEDGLGKTFDISGDFIGKLLWLVDSITDQDVDNNTRDDLINDLDRFLVD